MFTERNSNRMKRDINDINKLIYYYKSPKGIYPI